MRGWPAVVKVKAVGGNKEYTLMVSLQDTVRQVKERLSELTGFGADSMRLLTRRGDLIDDMTLRDCSCIHDMCIIYSVHRIRG